tara:strand:+ start:697 stop:1341 length:645 start_codon:yes stop_codon:yes gene_type:complete
MFNSDFNILCELKVRTSGYKIDEINNIKIKAIDNKSDFKIKYYSQETYKDFMQLGEYILTKDNLTFIERALVFLNKWGLPFKRKENEQESLLILKTLLLGLIDTKDKLSKGYEPTNKNNTLAPSTKLTYKYTEEGKVLPTFIVEDLVDAIGTTFWLTGDLSQSALVECLHYKTYGMRVGCKRFFPIKGRKKHCGSSCRDIYNQRQNRAIKKKGD